ncbi:protein of unknown function [Pararobbsia alpina]
MQMSVAGSCGGPFQDANKQSLWGPGPASVLVSGPMIPGHGARRSDNPSIPRNFRYHQYGRFAARFRR